MQARTHPRQQGDLLSLAGVAPFKAIVESNLFTPAAYFAEGLVVIIDAEQTGFSIGWQSVAKHSFQKNPKVRHRPRIIGLEHARSGIIGTTQAPFGAAQERCGLWRPAPPYAGQSELRL
jgi:hypothetical protein